MVLTLNTDDYYAYATRYDSPVKIPLFSKAENNTQKFDHGMSILGFCAALFGYKSVIFLCNLTTGQRRLPFWPTNHILTITVALTYKAKL